MKAPHARHHARNICLQLLEVQFFDIEKLEVVGVILNQLHSEKGEGVLCTCVTRKAGKRKNHMKHLNMYRKHFCCLVWGFFLFFFNILN